VQAAILSPHGTGDCVEEGEEEDMSNLTSSEALSARAYACGGLNQVQAMYEIASQLAGIRELMENQANPVVVSNKGPAKIIPFRPISIVTDGGGDTA
jgi:hypothetical protein